MHRIHRFFPILLLPLAVAGCTRAILVGRTPGPRGEVVVVHDDDDDGHGHGEGHGPRKLDRIPPGHYPPPGQCRLWYAGRPPGHQPRPQSCRKLRGHVPRGAFVLYNGSAWDADYDWHARERRRPGTVPSIILELLVVVQRR